MEALKARARAAVASAGLRGLELSGAGFQQVFVYFFSGGLGFCVWAILALGGLGAFYFLTFWGGRKSFLAFKAFF